MGDSGDSSFFHKLRLRVHQRLSRMSAGLVDRRKMLLLAGAGMIALLGKSASAADLARPAPVYTPPPPVVAVFTWTGCYVGGNLGGLWANDTWSDTVFGGFGGSTASGVLGGAQLGCNYQVGAWVFGVQADYDWTNANSNTANAIIPALVGGGPVVGLSDSTQHNALASVTGRVGYSWDRWLAYVKAGGAWLNSSYAFQVNGVNVASDSATQSGWTIGVGAEYAFLNWLTGFVEYDYYGFGSATPKGLVCPAGGTCGFVTNSVGITSNVNVVKAGLNFKFGPGGF
jgi:outer membrane immunogenic protein